MLVNLGTFYCVGMPIAVLLGFRFKLYAKVSTFMVTANICLLEFDTSIRRPVEFVRILLTIFVCFFSQGLWIGLICGLSVQTLGLLLLTKLTKWSKIETSNDSNANIKEDV